MQGSFLCTIPFKYITYKEPLEPIQYVIKEPSSQRYKTPFMLNSAEHELYPAHKC